MVREAVASDLRELLELYLDLHEVSVPEDGPRLRAVWARILADSDYHVIVNEAEGRIAASCTCVVVPNLTRGVRPYALIENVVTRADCRRRGLASECLARAREIAVESGCYKVMLMTGMQSASVLEFYRRCGYESDGRTAFIQWL